MSGLPRKLVIEVTAETDVAFTELIVMTGDNKTTIVNRAVQIYLAAERCRRYDRGIFAWLLRRWYV